MRNPRREAYDAWPAPFTVPRQVLDAAGAIRLPHVLRKWPRPGVMIMSLSGLPILACDGYCPWHDDAGHFAQYSSLLVLHNPSHAWVEAKGYAPVQAQPPGTIVLLDIWRTHRLNAQDGFQAPISLWVAICLDWRQTPSREAVEAAFALRLGTTEKHACE